MEKIKVTAAFIYLTPFRLEHLEGVFSVIYSYTLCLLLLTTFTAGLSVKQTCFLRVKLLLHALHGRLVLYTLQSVVF